jgi:hypothetical protein
VKGFARAGLKVSAITLWNQTCHVANLLELVHKALSKDIESGFVCNSDETCWHVIEDVENKHQQAGMASLRFRMTRSCHWIAIQQRERCASWYWAKSTSYYVRSVA